MATDDRKKRIREHLKQSSELELISAPKTIKIPSSESKSVEETIPNPEIIATPSIAPKIKRKTEIMDHVNRSSNFSDFSLSSEQRKKQIIEHIRKSID